MFIQKSKLTAEEQSIIKGNCLNFYISLSKQILERVDFNDPVLKAVEILDPSSLGQSLVPLIDLFPNLMKNIKIEDIDGEWRLLILDEVSQKEETLEVFWQNVFKQKNALGEFMYPNIKQFIGSLLCLPHSSASTERVFSQMKLIKTLIRNCLKVNTVNSILLIKEILAEYDLEKWVPPNEIIKNYMCSRKL